MVFKIDGVNIIPYLAYSQSIKWQRSDLDSDKAGRTLDGEMRRARIASKIRCDITCRPLRSEEIQVVLNLILPEFVQVEYTDPLYGLVTKTFYSNNNTAAHLLCIENGVEWWDSISFPLIER